MTYIEQLESQLHVNCRCVKNPNYLPENILEDMDLEEATAFDRSEYTYVCSRCQHIEEEIEYEEEWIEDQQADLQEELDEEEDEAYERSMQRLLEQEERAYD